jgi:tetratricopeptide (TPR) repeat protein
VDAQIAACTRQIGSGHFWGHDLAIEHYNRGIAWKAKGDLDRAIADYDQAIRLDPKHEHAYVNRGIAWKAKGDLERAIANYDQAIRLDPKHEHAYVNRGALYSVERCAVVKTQPCGRTVRRSNRVTLPSPTNATLH